jgi:hypothetical protein
LKKKKKKRRKRKKLTTDKEGEARTNPQKRYYNKKYAMHISLERKKGNLCHCVNCPCACEDEGTKNQEDCLVFDSISCAPSVFIPPGF